MPNDYPTGDDLDTYLRAQGIALPEYFGAMRLGDKARAAAAAWERATGWQPFLAVTQTRYLDPPTDSRYIPLNGGLLSVTSAAFGASSTTDGTAMTEGGHYRLGPLNAPARGLPYEWVEMLSGGYGLATGGGYGWPYSGLYGGVGGFGAGYWGKAGSIKMTGLWGRQETLTDDVFLSVLQKAALLCLAEMAGALTGGMSEWTQAGVTERFDPKIFAAFVDPWTSGWDAAVATYRRAPIYG